MSFCFVYCFLFQFAHSIFGLYKEYIQRNTHVLHKFAVVNNNAFFLCIFSLFSLFVFSLCFSFSCSFYFHQIFQVNHFQSSMYYIHVCILYVDTWFLHIGIQDTFSFFSTVFPSQNIRRVSYFIGLCQCTCFFLFQVLCSLCLLHIN